MKSNKAVNHIFSPEHTVADLAHLAWCALVAVRFAQRDSQALSPLTEHTFIMRWLASAQKQRRFSRSVAPTIENLLRLGRQKGLASDLHKRLGDLLQPTHGPATQHSDLLRLTYVIKSLKAQGWVNATITDDEWEPEALLAEYKGVSVLLVKKSDLVQNFANDGRLTDSVPLLVKGDDNVFNTVLQAQGLRINMTHQYQDGYLANLCPL